MKRYWLFVWLPYEALGGFNDFKTAYDSIDDKKYENFLHRLFLEHNTLINYQILDSFSGSIIKQGQYN